MLQPFSHIVEQRIVDDTLHLAIQTRTTLDGVADVPGVMTDNSLYRHISVDLTTGAVIDNFAGPIYL